MFLVLAETNIILPSRPRNISNELLVCFIVFSRLCYKYTDNKKLSFRQKNNTDVVCCFCYACWFGVEGLVKCGEPCESDSITNACAYLLRHQRANGGWGEDFTSCYDKEYASDGMKAYGDDGSGVVNTAWALLALSAARSPNVEAVKRGVQYLMNRQLPCGDWPQEGIAGVFNRACGASFNDCILSFDVQFRTNVFCSSQV